MDEEETEMKRLIFDTFLRIAAPYQELVYPSCFGDGLTEMWNAGDRLVQLDIDKRHLKIAILFIRRKLE